jgi:superfamily II DNA helicase RecQ
MILSKKFVKGVLRNPSMGPRVLSVVVDEAHVVSHWGSSFRKKYGTLGVLRALLPKGTPIVAMSATLPSRVRNDVLKKLQFGDDFIDLKIGNDRPNVSLVVRAIKNPMNTYSDLDFLIPKGVKDIKEVPKAMVYADQVVVGVDMEDRLYDISPNNFHETGFIRPYSAAFSLEYRTTVMALFKAGIVRILICTEAAGMVSSQFTISVGSADTTHWSRAVTYPMSIPWYSGNYHRPFHHLYRGPGEQRVDLVELDWLFCLLRNQSTTQIYQI